MGAEPDLACILSIHHSKVSEFPRLLPLVKVAFVRFFHFNHFNLYRPLCGNWKNTLYLLEVISLILIHYSKKVLLPVAHRKQFFFFFPALQTFTIPRRRSSLGVKMSLWRACLMAVMVDAVIQNKQLTRNHCESINTSP